MIQNDGLFFNQNNPLNLSKIKSKLGQAENFKIKPDRTATTKDKVKPIIAEETARLVETLYTNLNGVYACLKCNYNSLQKGHLKEHVEKHIEGLIYLCNFYMYIIIIL